MASSLGCHSFFGDRDRVGWSYGVIAEVFHVPLSQLWVCSHCQQCKNSFLDLHINRTMDLKPPHGFCLQHKARMSTCSSALTCIKVLHLLSGMLTSNVPLKKHGPWRSFEEVQFGKWTILHLKHPNIIQYQKDPEAGQLFLELNPGKLQAVALLLTPLGNCLLLYQRQPSLTSLGTVISAIHVPPSSSVFFTFPSDIHSL